MIKKQLMIILFRHLIKEKTNIQQKWMTTSINQTLITLILIVRLILKTHFKIQLF
jgi:hypothetical protein